MGRPFGAHLTWNKGRNIQFVSFSSWKGTPKWRQRIINKLGARNISVYAIRTDPLKDIYSASNIAQALGLSEPHFHQHEYLLHGLVIAESYRILAIFKGTSLVAPAEISIDSMAVDALIPEDFHSLYSEGKSMAEPLYDELYCRTGMRDITKLRMLAAALSGRND